MPSQASAKPQKPSPQTTPRDNLTRGWYDIQVASNNSVDLAFVDQGYIGGKPAQAAKEHGIELQVVKLPEAKRGFVLLPRWWVVERSFSWATRFRRLVKDYERLPQTLEALHIIAFVCIML